MHDDDGIYTATCHYFRNNGTHGLPHGTSTTQHTSQAAAYEALYDAVRTARSDGASEIDVVLTRDDGPHVQVIFAAGPRDIDQVHHELDEHRSPYCRAWEYLTIHANEILTELRNPHSPVHQPFSPELRDVAWSAHNVHNTPEIGQHESFERHLAGEVDRAKDRARGAGHSEAQIETAARTDPNLDLDLNMELLYGRSELMLDLVYDLAKDPALTPQQREALFTAVDQAKITRAHLDMHGGEPVASSVSNTTVIDTAITRDRSSDSEIPPLIEQLQASSPPPHVLDYPYPPQSTPPAQPSLSNDDARNPPIRRRDTDLGR
jgi:hypothetical protein